MSECVDLFSFGARKSTSKCEAVLFLLTFGPESSNFPKTIMEVDGSIKIPSLCGGEVEKKDPTHALLLLLESKIFVHSRKKKAKGFTIKNETLLAITSFSCPLPLFSTEPARDQTPLRTQP